MVCKSGRYKYVSVRCAMKKGKCKNVTSCETGKKIRMCHHSSRCKSAGRPFGGRRVTTSPVCRPGEAFSLKYMTCLVMPKGETLIVSCDI